MNRQTRHLMLGNKGTRAARGQDNTQPTIIERIRFRGSACDTSFANAPGNGNMRKHARRYKADEHMSLHTQQAMWGWVRRAA